jgi:hypothetical protein
VSGKRDRDNIIYWVINRGREEGKKEGRRRKRRRRRGRNGTSGTNYCA